MVAVVAAAAAVGRAATYFLILTVVATGAGFGRASGAGRAAVVLSADLTWPDDDPAESAVASGGSGGSGGVSSRGVPERSESVLAYEAGVTV